MQTLRLCRYNNDNDGDGRSALKRISRHIAVNTA